MKLQLQPRAAGSVLVATIVIVGIISVALGSYLSLVATQNRTVVSAYTWNTALPYAEAGVEEGLTHLVRTGGSNLAVNGWSAAGAEWVKSNSIADGGYSVKISGISSNWAIVSTGTAPRLLMPGSIDRTVRVTTTRRSRLPGIVALTSVRIGGNAYFDSYDSSDPLYSTNGLYSPALAKDNAFVATNGQTNSLRVAGSAVVKGTVATGPGGTITALGGASVGDSTYSSAGIQAGQSTDDFNFHAPDVLAPYASGLGAPSQMVDGTNYAAVLSSSGGQYIHAGNLSGSILVTQPATLYVQGNVATPLIRILPGASLTLFVGGSTFTLQSAGGAGIANEGGKPANFSLMGLPSLSLITLGGGTSLAGNIYAPSATFNPQGNTEIFGGVVVNIINTLSNFDFHFDEDLLKGIWDNFIIASWDEI